MTDLAIHSNKFSIREIATAVTVRIHLPQEVIRQVQVHPAVAAAVLVHQVVVVEAAVAVAQVVQAEVATKSYT